MSDRPGDGLLRQKKSLTVAGAQIDSGLPMTGMNKSPVEGPRGTVTRASRRELKKELDAKSATS